jgi:hypothetical protein
LAGAVQRRGGVGECAVRRGLPNVARGGDRDDDRILVDIHGMSENAVKTQIWIAVSVYVLVAIVCKRLTIATHRSTH